MISVRRGSREGEDPEGTDGVSTRSRRNAPLLSRLNFVIEEIEGIHRGAFVPWTRHPILQSIGATGIAIVTLVGALL